VDICEIGLRKFIEELISIMKMEFFEFDFDVFLCHNSHDKEAVIKIAEQLKANNIKPWLDISELRPGFRWQIVLEEQIETIKSAAVFIGKDGIGPWHNMEQEAFIRQFIKRNCPVIPVMLEDCPKNPKIPPFLDGMTRVDFRKSDPDPMKQLFFGITGKKP